MEESTLAGMMTFEEARALVLMHGGHSLAFSLLQPGMQYFGSASLGCIAFRRCLGQCTVLGDPVGPKSEREALLGAFLGVYPNALFMQVQRPVVEMLRGYGYRATPVGMENEIDIATYSLRGRSKGDVRHYRNRAVAGGVEVREEVDSVALRSMLKPVSDEWLPLKSWWGHELEFLARPFVLDVEPGVRIFTGRIAGTVVGFVIMDPMMAAGQCVGYGVTVLRHRHVVPEGTVDYIILQAMAQFRAEGMERLSLGVSPFYKIASQAALDGMGSWPVYQLFRLLNRWGNPIYHFSGLSFHKSRYRGKEVPVYCAVRGRFGLLALYGSARACRML